MRWPSSGRNALLFGSLIATYLVYKGRSLVGPYPHEILNIPFTSFSTFDLLMSSLAMVARACGRAARRHEARQALAVRHRAARSHFLGGRSGIQPLRARRARAHHESVWLNVLRADRDARRARDVGVIWLLTLWIQALRGKLGPQNALTVEITGLYWHFVTSCGS